MSNLKQKSSEQPLYGVKTGPDTIKFERVLPGPVERVWEYLTDSKKRGEWFASGPMELKPGGAIEFTFHNSQLGGDEGRPEGANCKGEGTVMTGKVLRVDPPRLLEFEMTFEGSVTPVLFELEPRGKDTFMRITHTRLPNRGLMVGVSAGWQTHVGIMAAKLAGETPLPFWSTHKRLQAEYETKI
jgi:uncharacterized protein YndB with AHSA1/START domain